MHRIAKAADVPAMARARAAAVLLGTGLIFLLPAHAAAASVTPVTTPVTLPTSPDSPSSELPPVPTTTVTLPIGQVPTTLPTVPVTVPSLGGLTTIPVLADRPTTPSLASEPVGTPTPPPSLDTNVAPAVPARRSSVDRGVAPPASRSREVPPSFTSAVRKAGPPFALPILVIVALSTYQLAGGARDRRDNRLASAVAEEQWVRFR